MLESLPEYLQLKIVDEVLRKHDTVVPPDKNLKFVNQALNVLYWKKCCEIDFQILPKDNPALIYKTENFLRRKINYHYLKQAQELFDKWKEINTAESKMVDAYYYKACLLLYLASYEVTKQQADTSINLAINYLIEAANASHPQAARLLAAIYRDGLLGMQVDATLAQQNYEMVLKLQHVATLRELGMNYLFGYGVFAKNGQFALQYLSLAAEKNDVTANLLLGIYYLVIENGLAPARVDEVLGRFPDQELYVSYLNAEQYPSSAGDASTWSSYLGKNYLLGIQHLRKIALKSSYAQQLLTLYDALATQKFKQFSLFVEHCRCYFDVFENDLGKARPVLVNFLENRYQALLKKENMVRLPDRGSFHTACHII